MAQSEPSSGPHHHWPSGKKESKVLNSVWQLVNTGQILFVKIFMTLWYFLNSLLFRHRGYCYLELLKQFPQKYLSRNVC